MLARYADAEGKVGKLAHEGVVRLHGLAPGEARELAVDFPVNRPGLPSAVAHVPIGGVTARSARATSSGGATTTPPAGRRREARSAAFSPLDAGLVDAVRAARAVLDEDRWRREVSRVVLKADEEVGLAVLLRGGTDLSRDVPEGEIAALPHDSERRRAYECLALHNQRLVRRIAQGHRGRKLDIEDLVQHGSIGLLGAVRRFDATRGNKFATYATACIEKAIVQAIADESPLVRLPKDVRERVGKVAKAERRLSGEGRALTVDNVAYVSGLTFAEVEEARRIRQPAGPARRPPIRVR
ncbi:sigma-70 family RNA polymerase sigma factor [Streptomyces atroolivaceus]|uniref:Sigma-70 family RNA polymerase sigma factor n=1 Tax=Streptomyces atroolivaceus TaxID=66869 RepID=A0ABV9VDB7_STRAZ|nr:sigma-70 family RNA polymerase sigma factor [Streptomyces atroolivaceus]